MSDSPFGAEGFPDPDFPSDINGLMREAALAHAREHMESDDLRNQLFQLCSELNVEQLMVMRYMLANPSEFMDGIVVGALVFKHGVDPQTGRKPEQHLLPEVGAHEQT